MGERRRKLLALLGVLGAVLCALVPAAALADTSSSSDSQTSTKYNFYPTAAAASVYLDNMVASGNLKNMGGGDGKLTLGAVASVMGFPDLDVIDTSTSTWNTYLTGDRAKNSITYSYDSFVKANSASENGKAIVNYGRMGQALSALGLDGTGDSGIPQATRTALARILQLAMGITNGLDRFMGWIVKVLKALNPFAWVGSVFTDKVLKTTEGGYENLPTDEYKKLHSYDEVDGKVSSDAADSVNQAIDNHAGNVVVEGLKNASQPIMQLYQFAYANSWLFVIPLMVAAGFVLTLIGKTGSTGGFLAGGATSGKEILKRALLTMLFVGILFPAWGVAYTAVLDKFDSSMSGGSNPYETGTTYSGSDRGWQGTNLVLQTLVDTAGWARTGFDTTGVGIKVDLDGNRLITGPDVSSVADIRGITLRINKKAGDARGYNTNDISTPKDGLLVADSDEGGAQWQWNENAKGSDKDSLNAYADSLLNDLASGATFESGVYNSYIAGTYFTDDSSQDTSLRAMAQLLQATANPETYANGLHTAAALTDKSGADDAGAKVDDTGIVTSTATKDTVASKAQRAEIDALYDKVAKLDSSASDYASQLDSLVKEIDAKKKENSSSDKAYDLSLASNRYLFHPVGKTSLDSGPDLMSLETGSDSSVATLKGALSPIGTYNYLNSAFDSSGVSVYSATKSANSQSHVSHYSVNIAGGGVTSILVATNAVLLMVALGVTTVVYGLGLLFSNLKRSGVVLMSTPFAALGMKRSAAQVMLVGIMMILELFVTAVLYTMLTSLLTTLNSAMTAGFSGAVSNLLNGFGNKGSLLFGPLMLIVAILLTLAYIIFAIKLRGAIIGSMDEGIKVIVNRLILGSYQRGEVGDVQSHGLSSLGAGAGKAIDSMGGVSGGGALATGLMAGAGMHAISNAGKGGDTINGDVIGDANASQSSVDNSARDSSTRKDGNTSNDGSTDAYRNDVTADGARGIEGGARQAGFGLMSGDVTGELTENGGDAATTDAMREAGDRGIEGDRSNDAYMSRDGDRDDSVNAGSAFASQASFDTADAGSANVMGDVTAQGADVYGADAASVDAQGASAFAADGADGDTMSSSLDVDSSSMRDASLSAESSANGYGADAYGGVGYGADGGNADAYGVAGETGDDYGVSQASLSADSTSDAHGADAFGGAAYGGDAMGSDSNGVAGEASATALGADAYGSDMYGADVYGADARAVSGDSSATSLGADAYGASAFGADAYGSDAYGANAFGADAYGADARGGNAFGTDARGVYGESSPVAAEAAGRQDLAAFMGPGSDAYSNVDVTAQDGRSGDSIFGAAGAAGDTIEGAGGAAGDTVDGTSTHSVEGFSGDQATPYVNVDGGMSRADVTGAVASRGIEGQRSGGQFGAGGPMTMGQAVAAGGSGVGSTRGDEASMMERARGVEGFASERRGMSATSGVDGRGVEGAAGHGIGTEVGGMSSAAARARARAMRDRGRASMSGTFGALDSEDEGMDLGAAVEASRGGERAYGTHRVSSSRPKRA